MVFESIVADLLNRFLGDYVENLDAKQLKLGIWGGDVELKDLVLKQTALKELDLPIQVVYGRLGNLVLKIPWKNLYYSPVIANIEGLYILAKPNTQIIYDAEKEEKRAQEFKQAELKRVEDAKKKAMETAKEKVDDTFVEKLTTQIIRNVQISIRDIHVRYEDEGHMVGRPFAAGFTLSNLTLQTTNEKWEPAIIYENIKQIFKIVELEGLAVYWNCKCPLYKSMSTNDYVQNFKNDIATKTTKPNNYTYILGPISSSARLILNQKPELNVPAFSIPKVKVNFEMEKLSVGITKSQFKDVIALADSMNMMMVGSMYRKHRPQVPYKGHYKEWWHFAYNCVLEFEVRRRRENWDWSHMHGHRKMCQQYGNLYHTKLSVKKCPSDVIENINKLEQQLDIFNILLLRQKIELEVERAMKNIPKVQEKKSWFSWWRSQEAVKPDADADTLVSQLQAVMTPEEKARLYKAIDYQAHAAPAEYPKSFVAVSCLFVLKMLQIEVVDDEKALCQVLESKLCSVKCKVEMRPAASAFKMHINMDQLLVSGIEQNNVTPQLITSEAMGEGALLDILFETNPIDAKFDQRVYITIKPIRVIYDSQTIISISSCFTIPQSTAMEQLSEATANTLNNVKTKSAAGLQHAIDSHTSLQLKVDLHAPIIILPYGGLYTGTENIFVVNLGQVKIESLEQKRTNIHEKQAAHSNEVEILQALMKESYDEFVLELTKLQVLLVPGGEDWTHCMTESKTSDMHLLDPLSLNLSFSKCLVQNDPRLPFNKISGTLPSLTINMVDSKILLLMSLIHSIPFPQNEPQESIAVLPVTSINRTQSSTLFTQYLEQQDKDAKSEKQVQTASDRSDFVQFTKLDVNFIMKELSIRMQHQEYASSPVEQIALLSLAFIECDVSIQTFAKDITLRLGYINFHKYHKDDTVELISTPICSKKGTYLFTIKFLQVEKHSPDFYTKHKACESLLDIEFAMLKVVLHQEALQGLVQYVTDLQIQLTEITSLPSIHKSAASMSNLKRKLSTLSETLSQSLSNLPLQKKPLAKEKEIERIDTITFKLTAKLTELLLVLANEKTELTSLSVKGVAGEVITKTPYTQVTAHLEDLLVTDLNVKSKYFKIVDVIGDQAVYFQVVVYDRNVANDKRNEDILVTAKLGRLRIVFLNFYVTTLLNFMNKFQAAEAVIVEASQAAAEQARQNVASVYENAIRVTLNISLDAPDILIPQSSTCYEAILLDLGHLTITNDFIALNVKNDVNQPAVIDNIKVELMKIKVSRVKLDEKLNILNDITILKPVTFTIMLKRNLSTSWYSAIPDIYVSGEVDIVELELGQPDYKMIMETLNGNLAEGAVETPKVNVVKSDVKSETSNILSVPSVFESPDTIEEKEELPLKLEAKIHIFVKFNFVMAKFIVSLFTVQPQTDPTSFDSPRWGLASFSLEGLSIKGRLLTDGTINTSVLLVDCLLEDIRSGSQKTLNRLFERKCEEDLVCPSKTVNPLAYKTMFDVTFKKKEDDLYLDLRISSFTLILSMEFLSKVQNFFTVALTTDTEPHVTVGTSKSISAVTQSSRSTINKPPPPEPSNMTINIKIEKPDIVLVEKMTCIDTNALILNCEAAIKYISAGPHQVVDGNVKDIMLYTCCYNPVKRKESMATVLEPFSINIAGVTPENKGLHIEVCITDIRICVSPATIDLLSRAYATMYDEEKGETATDEELFLDHSRMWEHQPYKDDDFWFLKTEYGVEAWQVFDKGTQTVSKIPLSELCIFTVSSIILSLEAGVGKKTLPMLLMESELHGKAKNWSSKMEVEATLTLQTGYYNSSLAVWEPLLEPVVEEVSGQVQSRPWSLKLEVAMNNPEETPIQSPNDSEVEIKPIEPAMSISLSSDCNLELTVSKAALEVIWNLSKAFETVVQLDSVKQEVLSPYKFKNDTGIPVIVNLYKGSFELYNDIDTKEVLLENGAVAPLQLIPSLVSKTSLHVMTELDKTYKGNEHKLYVKIPDINCKLILSIMRADKRYFSLKHRGDTNENWGTILSTVVDNGVIIMTLSSVLRVYNYFDIPVDVYYMTTRGNELECIGTVESGSFFNVPLKAVYTQTFELFFSTKDYCVTSTPFVWKDLKLNLSQTQILQSSPKPELRHERPFIFKVIGEIEQVFNETSVKFTMQSTMYNINLYPTILFRNSLPVDVRLSVQDVNEEQLVNASNHCVVSNVNPGSTYIIIRIPSYLEKEWSCKHDIATNPPEFSVWTFDSYDGFTKMSLDLGMHFLPKDGSLLMSLYCPFWMLNKSGVNISYRSSDENLNIIHHPSQFKGPILFSFNAKNFFGKKKASVRIRGGEWSDKFSIDVAGSSGVIICKENDRFYQLGVNIQLTYNGLTKQVTFTPYYVIINSAYFTIECQEHDRPADPWTVVQPKSCASFWPVGEFDDKLIRLRVAGTEEVSAPFLISESHTTLLKLQNKYGGVNVDIQLTEGAIYINLAKYDHGMAPALIINHTRDTMNFWERDTVQLKKLAPGHKFFYTWDYPAGQRVLVWEGGYKEEILDDLRKDGAGEYSIAKDSLVYWVSFLDGMQRVLLFTCEETIAKEAQTSKHYEQIDQEIVVSIYGLGLSLVDNTDKREIMYLGIAPSGVIWETCKESLCKYNRYKQMSVKDSESMEEAYQNYLEKRDVPEQEQQLLRKVTVDAKTEVDFSLNTMYKPHKRRVRRTFLTGLWLQMRTNSSLMQLHGKINRLQIDNQMLDCIFPVVLAPVPPPKSVAAIDVHKPFAELSVVQLLIKHSQIKQFKYFKILIQEFHVKLDLGFVNAVLSVIQGASGNLEEEKQMFSKDMELVDNPLYAHVYSQSLQEQKSFYDLLHFSPLKIHVSFTVASSTSTQGMAAPNVINVLLQGLGVTLTDLQDVVFKLAYFEKEYTFLTQKQLTNDVTSHYIGQAVKQLYVLVLGLDVLGNPYGLVLGITKGVEDLFYEPFQGAIQGPGEFAEGLALGVRSLFGHTVGGAAGAVSRITGAMGKGLATLTFDKDYQRKRRDQMNTKPQTVSEGLARSGKGLVMGVYDGVTGVFRKPISGAKEQGVGGFIKGLGKGAVGLVTRPTAGVMDFASSSLDTVKRVTELGTEEARRLRPPRFIHADGVIRPYNFKESQGNKLLIELDKGKYANTDSYVSHFVIIVKKEILLFTDKRLGYIVHNDLFGGWQMEWSYTWQELSLPPKIVPKGVMVSVGEGKKKKKGLFGAADTGKTILISDNYTCEQVCAQIEALQKPPDQEN